MKLSKFVSGLAWVNTFALLWVMMYGPVPESRSLVAWGVVLFVAVALIASAIQAQEKK